MFNALDAAVVIAFQLFEGNYRMENDRCRMKMHWIIECTGLKVLETLN